MSRYKKTGYFNAVTAAVSYGMNPLFSLPMYNLGYGVNSVLFYRYFFAVLLYGLWLKFVKKISFNLTIKEALSVFILAIAFSFSSLFLFDAFNYIESGLACTILFSYPIIVAVISKLFFKEKMPVIIWLSLFMILIGIFMLYDGNSMHKLNLKGIYLVLLSAFSYALYMIGVNRIKTVKHIKTNKLTFYVMLFGLSIYVWNLKFCTQLQPLNSYFVTCCALLLAIFPTILSIETVTTAVKLIGATPTAILGALEPLTALFFGVILFGETITLKISCGIFLILTGVIIVIMQRNKKKKNFISSRNQ